MLSTLKYIVIGLVGLFLLSFPSNAGNHVIPHTPALCLSDQMLSSSFDALKEAETKEQFTEFASSIFAVLLGPGSECAQVGSLPMEEIKIKSKYVMKAIDKVWLIVEFEIVSDPNNTKYYWFTDEAAYNKYLGEKA